MRDDVTARSMIIRPATHGDADAIRSILEPVVRAGETFALPRDWDRGATLAYWLTASHRVFVAEDDAAVLGTYYLRPNQLGGGGHVANAAYAVRPQNTGRGVARAMGLHSFETAREAGFTAMQFNFVVASNTRAVALWQGLGMQVVGRLPDAFRHPDLGLVDALVMYRRL